MVLWPLLIPPFIVPKIFAREKCKKKKFNSSKVKEPIDFVQEVSGVSLHAFLKRFPELLSAYFHEEDIGRV